MESDKGKKVKKKEILRMGLLAIGVASKLFSCYFSKGARNL